jgi:hypothetical protein
MMLRIIFVGIFILFVVYTSADAANLITNNPADRIKNPAAKMYNPATDIHNPAANINNPAANINNPNPLVPVTQPIPPIPEPTVTEAVPTTKPESKPTIPHKKYHFKSVKKYVNAAKKAFIEDDYIEFLTVTEDALRRINAGTLKASKNTRQKLINYRVFGYGLLGKGEELKP